MKENFGVTYTVIPQRSQYYTWSRALVTKRFYGKGMRGFTVHPSRKTTSR